MGEIWVLPRTVRLGLRLVRESRPFLKLRVSYWGFASYLKLTAARMSNSVSSNEFRRRLPVFGPCGLAVGCLSWKVTGPSMSISAERSYFVMAVQDKGGIQMHDATSDYCWTTRALRRLSSKGAFQATAPLYGPSGHCSCLFS